MKKIKMWNLAAFGVAFALLIGCQKPTDPEPDYESTEIHEEPSDYVWNPGDVVTIQLLGSSIAINGPGATASGSKVTITQAGTYSLSGTLANGQVVVNTSDDEAVQLILNGVTITSASSAPIYVKDAKKVIIILEENTENTLTDGLTYVYDVPADEEPNAAIFSKSDLTLYGTGALTVTGRFGDGIASKDGLIIKTGTITVNAADDGIRGKDYLLVEDGSLHITANADGLKSSNDTDAALGNVTINGGTITIAAGDDGIHAESRLVINNGTINITKSYEGIESKAITINGGTIHLVSSDDGVNAAGGSSGTGGGFGGMGSSGNYTLDINGGYLVVHANGDGLDANGSITMTDGMVLVNGPTANNNGALDYDGTFKISGGFLLAVGSTGMAQAPGTSSTQNSLLASLPSAQAAGIPVHIRSSEGKTLFTFTPAKKYQSVAFSSPDLTNGSSYDLYYGGNISGGGTDGLYTEGTYTGGTKYTSFTVSSVVTKVNAR